MVLAELRLSSLAVCRLMILSLSLSLTTHRQGKEKHHKEMQAFKDWLQKWRRFEFKTRPLAKKAAKESTFLLTIILLEDVILVSVVDFGVLGLRPATDSHHEPALQASQGFLFPVDEGCTGVFLVQLDHRVGSFIELPREAKLRLFVPLFIKCLIYFLLSSHDLIV